VTATSAAVIAAQTWSKRKAAERTAEAAEATRDAAAATRRSAEGAEAALVESAKSLTRCRSRAGCALNAARLSGRGPGLQAGEQLVQEALIAVPVGGRDPFLEGVDHLPLGSAGIDHALRSPVVDEVFLRLGQAGVRRKVRPAENVVHRRQRCRSKRLSAIEIREQVLHTQLPVRELRREQD
jgi:hypothetical protein